MPTADTSTASSTASTAEVTPQSQVLIRDGFVWDEQNVYLFDIDGTLLRSRDRIHFHSFPESVRQVTGQVISLEGVAMNGGTDTAILREAFALAGIADAAWEPQQQAILEAMRQIVHARRSEMDLWTMPAVSETLTHLAAKGALLGLATGNLESIGWLKVEEVGLRQWFRFGGFSDRFEIRSEMVADAMQQARAIAGNDASICVVGDTPRDISAARANGIPVIAVATGNFTFEQLAALAPDACATSLATLLRQTSPGIAGNAEAQS
jgi:phosphoglycolate phosphatase-like HAD superfamily hydrolase